MSWGGACSTDGVPGHSQWVWVGGCAERSLCTSSCQFDATFPGFSQASGTGHPQRCGLCGTWKAIPGPSLYPRCSQYLLRQHAGHQVEGQERRGSQAPPGVSICLGRVPASGRAVNSCWVVASDLPFYSACRSTRWPLGLYCSTCIQVTDRPRGLGQQHTQGGPELMSPLGRRSVPKMA